MRVAFNFGNLTVLLVFLSFISSVFAENSDEKINMLAQKDSTKEAYTYRNDVEEDIWRIFLQIDNNSVTIVSPKTIEDINQCNTLSDRLDGLTSLYSKLMNGNIHHLKRKIKVYSQILTTCSNAKIEKTKTPKKKQEPPVKSALKVVNENLKLTELSRDNLRMVITNDISFPGRLNSRSNRSFVFSNGSLFTPIQGDSTYYEQSVNLTNCDIFTYADFEAPVTLKKGTVFKVRVNEVVNSDVTISNLDFTRLNEWENIHSITCSRGYSPTDENGNRSPIPAYDFTVADFHKQFGYAIVLASLDGSGPPVSEVSGGVNFPKDKLSMSLLKNVSLRILNEQTLVPQTASGWGLVYNNKHYFFSDKSHYFDSFSSSGSSNYVPYAPFDENFDFITAARNELVCNISFYRDNENEYTFKKGDTLKLVREYRLENTLLLEFDNHNKSSQKPRFIRCFRDNRSQKPTKNITFSDVEKVLGFVKIEDENE